MMLGVYIVCRRNPQLGPATPRASWKERWTSLSGVWGILVLFFLVMGGIYAGIFPPTEGAAVGAFGALVLGLVKRRLTWKSFAASVSEAGQMTGIIIFLFIGAMIFNYFIALTEVPFEVARFISGLPVHPIVVLVLVIVVFILFGFIMDIL